MVSSLVELAILFAAAALLGLGIYQVALPMLGLMIWRGWKLVSGEAQKHGWPETVLAFAIPASAILCFRALRAGHWF